jgi:hypothetical protein
MASDTAVAEAPPQAELEQLLPATFQCFTVFGTLHEREIPKALLGSPRRGGAFAQWYSAQWKMIRYELAALGNIAARESIKQEADRKRGWQQLPANMVHRNERARLARRVRALKVAREGEAARWAKIKIPLEEMKRMEMEESKRLLRQAKERRVRLKEKAELNQQRSWPWPEKYKEMVNYVEERVAYDCTWELDGDLADVLSQGLRMEVLSWKLTQEEPQGCSQSSQDLNMGNEIAIATAEATALATLSETVAFALKNSQERLAWAVAFELNECVTRASFVHMFDCVMNMGANTAPFIPKLVTFTRAWENKAAPQLRK